MYTNCALVVTGGSNKYRLCSWVQSIRVATRLKEMQCMALPTKNRNVTCGDFYVKICFPYCSEYVVQVQ